MNDYRNKQLITEKRSFVKRGIKFMIKTEKTGVVRIINQIKRIDIQRNRKI
jgi:hypothetical protein